MNRSRKQPLLSEDVITEPVALLERVMPLIQRLGPFVINDPSLCTVVCRLFAACLEDASESLRASIREIYKTCLLPALSLGTPNCPMNQEVWCGLKWFSQSDRFDLYAYWQSEVPTSNPDLLFGLKKNYLAIDYALRRIAAANVKEMSRILTYYSYATPIFFFRSFLYKCTTFDNLIKLIVPQLKPISSLGIDCCMYCILESLDNRKVVLEEDGVTIERGYALIIEFTVSVVRMLTHRADVTLLMRFVEKKLREGDVTVMVLVSKLISDVANVRIRTDFDA